MLSSLSVLLFGPSHYRARSPWSASEAILLALLVVLVALLAGAAIEVITGGDRVRQAAPEGSAIPAARAVWLQLAVQLVTVLLLVRLSSARGASPEQALALVAPPGAPGAYLALPVALWLAYLPLDLAALQLAPEQYHADLRAIDSLVAEAGVVPTLLVVVVGAAIAEEMLFRGFLFGALAGSRLGPVLAAVVTSALWAGVHFYSPIGRVAVFALGLGACFLLWRTGSLLACIAWHGFNNLATLALLYLGVFGLDPAAPG